MTGLADLIKAGGGIIQTLTLIMAGAALLVFLWGLAKFIFKVGSSEKAVEEGRNIMTWGLVALFVMISVWGIVGFFQRAFGLPNPTATQNAPTQGNAPTPGVLPSTNYNPFLNQGNAPTPGNLPIRGNPPWWDLLFK